ncbi:MAG: carbamoyl-phosphate synthase [Archangiaceae bacterium]|nr:carbamoyl-phosphate synthase [Archangiaceae bacterium]
MSAAAKLFAEEEIRPERRFTRSSQARPGALLLVADFHGTLAGVRSLGRAGIDVTVADWRRLVPARWSRFTRQSLTCPDPTTDPRGFMGWLLETGKREPGKVLLPTTDDLAWLFARHRAQLEPYFVLDAPPLDAVYALLNKWRLREACAAVGIETPATWLPDADSVDSDTTLRFPLLIKPQTQTLLYPHQKGRVVRARAQLRELYDDFRHATRHASALLEADPRASQPILQELVETPGIYGLSGFIDTTGALYVVSAARKVLQKPKVMGIGLCFQQAPVDAALAARLRALCRHVGYHGLFEVEFLEENGRHLLIDFNPRCYGQLGFDVSRGADLPLMAYLHAVGDWKALEGEVAAAQRKLAANRERAWCDRINLEAFMALRRLSGEESGTAVQTWAQWLKDHSGHLTDAVMDDDDRLPGVIAALTMVVGHLKHPRSTLRAVREK